MFRPGSSGRRRVAAVLFSFSTVLVLAGALPASECCRIEMEHVVFEAFEKDGRYGFRLKGSDVILIEPRYDFATTFTSQGIAAVVDGSGWAWIDRTAKVLARPHVVDNGPDTFSDGLTRIVENGRYGFMNEHGRVVIAARFAYAEPFDEGYALICADCTRVADGNHVRMTGRRCGAVDLTGEIVVDLEHARHEAVRALNRSH